MLGTDASCRFCLHFLLTTICPTLKQPVDLFLSPPSSFPLVVPAWRGMRAGTTPLAGGQAGTGPPCRYSRTLFNSTKQGVPGCCKRSSANDWLVPLF